MLITPASLDAAFVGFSLRYSTGLQSVTTQYAEIADVVTDAVGELKFPISEGFPAFREWPDEEERVYHNLAAHVQNMVPKDWEQSVRIPKNKFKDDQYGVFGKDFEIAGRKAGQLWDTLCYEALLAGKTQDCFTGVEFFSDSHPLKPSDPTSAVQANLFGGRAFNETNYEAAQANFMAWKDPTGKEIEVPANELWVGSPNWAAAQRLAKAEFGAGGATNIHYGTIKPRLIPGLGTSWCLASTDQGYKPIALFQREAPQLIQLVDPSMPHVVDLREYRYVASARGTAMLTLPGLLQFNQVAAL